MNEEFLEDPPADVLRRHVTAGSGYSFRSDGWIVLPDDPGLLPWTVAVLVRNVDGLDRVLGLELKPPVDGEGNLRHGLQVSDLVMTDKRKRALPLAEIRRRAVMGRNLGQKRHPERIQREPGKAWPREHYEAVAEVYRAAVNDGRPPLDAIEKHWGVSRHGARKWVRLARHEHKVLGEAKTGVPGERDSGLSSEARNLR